MALEDVYARNLEHRTHRAGWLRAAVLGANDGLVSTAALMIGVAAAGKQDLVITAGVAGITAGAMSMAVGEYVSVRSQNDIEESDRLLEIEHLAIDPDGELEELIEIYINRGLSRELATQVATTIKMVKLLCWVQVVQVATLTCGLPVDKPHNLSRRIHQTLIPFVLPTQVDVLRFHL